MNEGMMAEVQQLTSLPDTSASASAVIAAPPPPPPPQRRPRVREVSSRFMSPVASSSSAPSLSGDLHPLTAKSPHHKQRLRRYQDNNKEMESMSSTDENRQIETARSLESPFHFHSGKEALQRRHQNQRSVMKLFNENGGPKLGGRSGNSSRPDTPTVMTSSPSSSSSRSRVIHRSTSNAATAATKLLQSLSAQTPNNASPEDNSSLRANNSSLQNSLTDSRSSTTEADLLPTVSPRFLAERNVNRVNVTAGDSAKFSASPCTRSLNLSLFPSAKGSVKPTPAVSRSYTNSGKTGGLSLPPVAPPQVKPGTDVARKAKKVSSHQEDVHCLRLLQNHYLQWRFANAKAEDSMHAQRRETEATSSVARTITLIKHATISRISWYIVKASLLETLALLLRIEPQKDFHALRTLYSLGVKISELYDSVKRKRIELGILQRMTSLSTILETQMPYLEEWCAFEGEYSVSLSEAIQALLNTSLQLPIGGNVRADVREVGEALNSAIKLMEIISLQVHRFMPKAEEVEILISELAKVTGGERALVEECGDLLSKTYAFQVEECSLSGHVMQLQQRLPTYHYKLFI